MLTEQVSSLRQDVHRFRMRCSRSEEICSHEVEKAVNRVRNRFESVDTKMVKRPDGRIEDWARDLVVELVALDGVPTAKVPQVIERVRSSFVPKERSNGGDGQACKKQTISDRSVRRMLVEAHVKGFMHTAELFKRSPCQHQNLYNIVNDDSRSIIQKPGPPAEMVHRARAQALGPTSPPFPQYPFSKTLLV